MVVGGVISIEVDGGIMELDPAGDRPLLDISGFVDERDILRRIIFGVLRAATALRVRDRAVSHRGGHTLGCGVLPTPEPWGPNAAVGPLSTH